MADNSKDHKVPFKDSRVFREDSRNFKDKVDKVDKAPEAKADPAKDSKAVPYAHGTQPAPRQADKVQAGSVKSIEETLKDKVQAETGKRPDVPDPSKLAGKVTPLEFSTQQPLVKVEPETKAPKA